MKHYSNPVISGFNPDPSVCRVGDDFYLATSSFEFFPGVPIHHSRNLVDWELVGHALSRDSQLPLAGIADSGGIYAPTLRHHEGTFYLITTLVGGGGNFIVQSQDIRGPWSEPHWVDQPGIDPSLFFDDDGSCYFCGTDDGSGRSAITAFKIDPDTGLRIGEKKIISYGAGGKFPEAPHLYKFKGTYYLMLAEGGTEYGHRETIFRSDHPLGPFEPCPHNPILSHQEDGQNPIQATGHADLVEDARGNWWLVCLGIRPLPQNMLHNLGRETFLTPVRWDEDGWPVVGDQGRIALSMTADLPKTAAASPKGKPISQAFETSFDGDRLDPELCYVRNPERERYRQSSDGLLLIGGDKGLQDLQPTMTLLRQKAFELDVTTKMSLLAGGPRAMAGLAAYYNHDYFYALSLERDQDRPCLRFQTCLHGQCHAAAPVPIERHREGEAIWLRIEADREYHRFSYRLDPQSDWQEVARGHVAGLCTEGTHAMTFTGSWLGLFARDAKAVFHSFKAEPKGE